MPHYPKWLILQHDEQDFDVWKNGRIFAYNLSDLDSVLSRIKRSRFYQKGDDVELSGPDGRRKITKLP